MKMAKVKLSSHVLNFDTKAARSAIVISFITNQCKKRVPITQIWN